MSTCNTNPCPHNKHRLPCKWIDILISKYNNASKGDAWQDANCAWFNYQEFKQVGVNNKGIMCSDDVPASPDFSQFSDNSIPRTAC